MNLDDVLRAELTEQQYEAATDTADEVLTLACAGSGKSKTLAYRIARLIGEGEEPNSIVAFTFTEKAADSIKQRVAEALIEIGADPNLIGAMYVGTIHSYCQMVLGEMDARYRQFDVLDDNRLKLYLISRYLGLGIAAVRDAHPPVGGGNRAGYFRTVDKVATAWTTLNDELASINEVNEQDAVLGNTLAELQGQLDRDEFIDFSLMIRLVADALVADEPGALRATEEVRHLLVDEYQDVNPAQEVLIEQLRVRGCSLFVTGDDDQSIYSWRGADVGNILTFHERYPDSAEHTLSHNFRSTPAIVNVADGFAAAELGATRISKNPTADTPEGPRDLRAVWFDARSEEAEWVASRIEELLGTAYRERDGTVRGLTLGDFAIMMRSTRTAEGDGSPRHEAFTAELEGRGLTYSLEAGGGIFDRPQVAALRDSFLLLRDRTPDRKTAESHFSEVVQPAFPHADFTHFTEVMALWGREIHAPSTGARRRVFPQQLVHELLEAFGLAQSDFDDGVMRALGLFSRIMQDVEAVFVSIDSTDRFTSILNFLQNVAETGYDTATEDVLRRPDLITVSTVHKMKGLEFPVVFVVDVEQERFPKNKRKYEGWLPAGVIQPALDRGAYQSTRAEEARLFYTALTRAERYLYVSGSEQLPAAKRAKKKSAFAGLLAHAELSDDPSGLPAGLETAAPQPRIDEAVMPTTYSEIRYYLRCPADYRFRKSYGFSPPITEMFGFGMTIHAGVGKLHELNPDVAPSPEEARELAEQIFHLKHVPQSGDPERPGPYERARDSAGQILANYTTDYADDFTHQRQVELRFEVPIQQGVISGSIDLLLRYDDEGNLIGAGVIDFKTMEGGDAPEENRELDWTELVLQVQLYALGAQEVHGEHARTGAVHLLKDGQRIDVPVDDEAVAAAVANVEWGVERILARDFPMRPADEKCEKCDYGALCAKQPEEFSTNEIPPPIHLIGGELRLSRAFSEFEE
jgi:DNA helicase-2/ATP-dependent DNA helicase PcrA